MKSPIHSFSKVLCASAFSSSTNFLTMNISTTPRRVAQGLLVLCFTLASMAGAKAQCGDFSAVPSGPVTINMTLGGGGTVNLTNAILNGSGFFIPGGGSCDMWLSSDPNPNNLGSYTNTPITFTCADVATSPQTWHVRAGGNGGVGISGNGGPGATIIDITINVIDNIPPTVMCPANVVTTTDPGLCDTWQFGIGATSADNCSATHTWSQISGPPIAPFFSTLGNASGALFAVGTSVVRYTAIDPSTNTATCEFSVTVTDDEPAVITCPPNQSVGTAPSTVCNYTYVGANATATDNCTPPPPTIVNNFTFTSTLAGAVFPAGLNGASNTTTVIWTATAPGIPGSVNCSQTITVVDNDQPVFTSCPMSVTVNATGPAACNYTGTVALNPNATDNCSAVSFSNSYDATNTLVGKLFPIGVYNITWTATDVQLNSTNNCNFTLTVKDVSAPVVMGPTSQTSTFSVTAGDCAKVVTFTRPAVGAVADCTGPVIMTEAYFSGQDPNVLTGAPAFSPGSTITVQFPAGTTVIRYTWTDAAVPANTFSIDYTFIIDEDEDPTANCVSGPVSIALDPLINGVLVTAAMLNNGSTDNCGIFNMTVSPSILDCTQLGTQSVTLTVTDFAGNTDDCTTTVFVSDNTLPVIGCPSSFVVAANALCQASLPGLIFTVGTSSPAVMEYYDNALDPCGLTFDYQVNGLPIGFTPLGLYVGNPVDLSGVVFLAGNNSVTLRAEDGSGNITVCNFTVSVQDQTGPYYATPVNPGPAAGSTIIANVPNIGSCSAKAIWLDPVFVDDCPGAVTIVSQAAFSNVTIFSADNGGITPVTYVFKDAAGNLTTHIFNVKVNDTQFPVAKCKDIMVNLSATIGAGSVVVTPANIDNVSTDNCGYSYVSGNVTYTCANIGTNNYTLQIKDDANNNASCIGVVTVKDVTAPVLTCPGNVTVNTPLLPVPASCVGVLTGSVSAVDNCTVSGYQYALGVVPGAFVPFAGGNLANIPAFPLGTTTVNIRATDGVLPTPNISNICVFTVTIKDITPPVFAGVPANTTVACNAIPPVTNPTATDNCGTATVAYSGQTFSAGVCTFTITRTWVASDNAVPSNTISASQVITVQDIVGPVFDAAFIPSGTVNINVTSSLVCTGNFTLNVINNTNIADACNGVSGIAYTLAPAIGAPSSGVLTLAAGVFTLPVSTFPIGNNVVTLTATDACGNPTLKVVTIVVADNQAPVFQNNYAAAPTGICGKIFTLPNTTNNCDQLFVWTRPALSDIFDCGAISKTEVINNTSVQSFVNLIIPFVTFPHSSVIAQFPVGETTITYTATQGANLSTCSFIVKILDTQAPSITCPGNQNLSISAACAAAATVPTYPPASISDNCPSNVTITQTPAPTSLVSLVVPVVAGNSFTVTLKATDNFPNNLMSAPCSFTVTLVDGLAPVPVITTLADLVSNCTKDTVTAPSATDCNGTNIVTIYGTPSVPVMMVLPPLVPGGPPRYVLNPGSYVITWSYTDPQNNTSTQPQNVFIAVDLTGPIAIALPLNVNLSALGSVTVTAAQLNNGSFDQDGCGPVTVSIRTGIFPIFVYVPSINLSCANLGLNIVVFAATDINGNVSTIPTTVTVNDVTPPSFVNAWSAGQMDTVIQACQLVPDAAAFPQTAADQCDLVVNINLVETSTQTGAGCSKYSYVINRTWTATDDSGNTATRTQKIIVADTQAPVYAANTPASVTFNTAPNALVCNAAVTFNMATFVSDCQLPADVTITNALISAPVGNTFVIPAGANISAPNYPVGTYIVRFTSTDNCGNRATKDVTIQVVDATPPTAVCINGVSTSLQPSGTVIVTVNQFNNNSYDNCTSTLGLLIQRLDQNPLVAPTPSLEYNCPDADGVTHHSVKLFVSDAVGNMSMCLTYIVIQDNVAPAITCPPNKTVQCSDILTPAVQGVATATDNCPIVADSISHTDAIGGGVGNICQVLTRTWKVVDLADNVTTCNQLISIQDTVKPVFTTLPPNVTVSCSDGVIAVIPVSATDNCDPNVQVQLTVDTISIAQGDCGLFDYIILRTWTATDQCGNVNVHTRQIKVVDITDPEFAGMPDSLVLNTSQFPPNLTCTVPLVLNVAQFLDDCSPDSILLVTNDAPFGDNSFSISGDYPIGDYLVSFTAIDACGNVGIDSIFIKVTDNSVPTMVCNNNVVISLGTNGAATIDANDIDLGSTDNCAIGTLVLSQNIFDCGDLGIQTISLTATDIYGNTNSCAVQVQVTLGTNAGFNLVVTGTAESYFGADDGTATAVATGGSGVFTYNWSAAGGTTASITGLAGGTYTVTVTDTQSGCIFSATATVPEGPKITVTVGTGSGCQGATISIPVTVDNFINVSGFSLGLTLSNAAAGTIVGLTNVNPALVGLVPGVSSVFWTHPTLDPTDLSNGSLLFNLEVQLSNAVVGTTSSINASALPALIFLQDGVNQAPMVNFNAGTASISCLAANDLEIAGDVFTWKAPVKPIPGVNVSIVGTVNATDVTALPNADYGFFVSSGANETVSAQKIATVKNQQINVGDMLGIQAHAAMQVAFNNGFQWVAADVNIDMKVNLIDYALVQKYVLGNLAHFTDNQGNQVGPDWKFIPTTHVFLPLPPLNPQAPMPNPLNNPIPLSNIVHNNIVTDFLNDDFRGVLMGDVNGSVIPSLTNGGNGGGENSETLKFRLDERAVQAGEIVTIPFKSLDFTGAQAYQMTIAFDPEVFELQNIEAGVLPGLTESNFGTDNLADGLLSTLWVGGKPTSFNDNETLFSLTFKALESVPTLSSVLHISSVITEALAIDEAGNPISVDFEYVSSVATGDVESKVFALYQNQPNPFNSETSISFRLPESGRATLRVFSAEGRLLKTVIGDFAEGINAITFRKDDIGSNGVFYYELETPKHSDRKKMILID